MTIPRKRLLELGYSARMRPRYWQQAPENRFEWILTSRDLERFAALVLHEELQLSLDGVTTQVKRMVDSDIVELKRDTKRLDWLLASVEMECTGISSRDEIDEAMKL